MCDSFSLSPPSKDRRFYPGTPSLVVQDPVHLWGCLCLQVRETWPKWAGTGFVVSQFWSAWVGCSRLVHSGKQWSSGLFPTVSDAPPITKWLSIATVTTPSPLGEEEEDATGFTSSTMDLRQEEKWDRWWETKWTDIIKFWGRAGMAEERRESAQTKLEREISGLNMKERRGTLGH